MADGDIQLVAERPIVQVVDGDGVFLYVKVGEGCASEPNGDPFNSNSNAQ